MANYQQLPQTSNEVTKTYGNRRNQLFIKISPVND